MVPAHGSAPDGVAVRRATAAELSAVIALLLAQLREHGSTLAEDEIAAAATALFEQPERGRFLVAVDGGAVIGMAALTSVWSLERGGVAVWLDELYVRPERRGRGIGQALLELSLASAREMGARAIELEVDREHARAENLYRRAGFDVLPRRRWFRVLA